MNKHTYRITGIFLGLLIILQSAFGQAMKKNKKRSQVSQQLIVYPVPQGLQTSSDFTVKVNNTEIWTERVGDGEI